jgi:hypothetical protein
VSKDLLDHLGIERGGRFIEHELAGLVLFEMVDASDHARLAGSGRAANHDPLARRHRKVDIPRDVKRTEPFVDVAQLDSRRRSLAATCLAAAETACRAISLPNFCGHAPTRAPSIASTGTCRSRRPSRPVRQRNSPSRRSSAPPSSHIGSYFFDEQFDKSLKYVQRYQNPSINEITFTAMLYGYLNQPNEAKKVADKVLKQDPGGPPRSFSPSGHWPTSTFPSWLQKAHGRPGCGPARPRPSSRTTPT